MANRKAVPEPTTKAVLYFRVSTDKQEKSGLGLESQTTRCRLYAQAQGLEVVGEYTEAMSAKTLARPQLQAAIASLRPGCVLIALKLDRFIRTAADADAFTSAVKAHGADWATVEGSYDTSTAMGAFMVRLMAELAQLEREQVGERTRYALQAKQARGEYVGGTPYGYKVVDGRLEVDRDATDVLARIVEARAAGLSYRSITQSLNADGIPTAKGGRWSQATVWGIVERHNE